MLHSSLLAGYQRPVGRPKPAGQLREAGPARPQQQPVLQGRPHQAVLGDERGQLQGLPPRLSPHRQPTNRKSKSSYAYK